MRPNQIFRSKSALPTLEKEFSELRAEVIGLRSQTKDWRRTVGMIPDDETSRSAARLGREWRQRASEE